MKQAVETALQNEQNIYRSAEPAKAGVHHCTKNFIQSLQASEHLNSPSDLVSGVYEGGFKVWECTQDLLDLLTGDEVPVKGKSVVDVGCGSGLLGIKCLLEGASQVIFQDFNVQVVESCTAANLLLNLKLKSAQQALDEEISAAMSKCQLVACDWDEFNADGNKFDLILSSETIYNEDNYGKLINLFKRSLAQDGRVVIGCKSHYFGVGGGSDSFQEYVKSEETFECKVIKEIETPLRRDILELRLIK